MKNKKKLTQQLVDQRIKEKNAVILNAFSMGATTFAKLALTATKEKIEKAITYEQLRIAADELVWYLEKKITQTETIISHKENN